MRTTRWALALLLAFAAPLDAQEETNRGDIYPGGAWGSTALPNSGADGEILFLIGNETEITGHSNFKIVTTGSQQITVGTGDAGGPAFSFTLDPDTGMYWYGFDNLGFSTDGQVRWIIDDSGHLAPLGGANIGYSGAKVGDIWASGAINAGTVAVTAGSLVASTVATTTLTESVATDLFTIAIPQGDQAGGEVHGTALCEDATNVVVSTSFWIFSCYNDGGTEDCYVDPSTDYAVVSTVGSFTDGTVDFTTGTDEVTFRITAVCSLTQTLLELHWELRQTPTLAVAVTLP